MVLSECEPAHLGTLFEDHVPLQTSMTREHATDHRYHIFAHEVKAKGLLYLEG